MEMLSRSDWVNILGIKAKGAYMPATQKQNALWTNSDAPFDNIKIPQDGNVVKMQKTSEKSSGGLGWVVLWHPLNYLYIR